MLLRVVNNWVKLELKYFYSNELIYKNDMVKYKIKIRETTNFSSLSFFRTFFFHVRAINKRKLFLY